MSQIKFVQLSQAKYDEFALIEDTTSVNYISANKIYFTTDTNRIYKGTVLFTGNFEVLPTLPAQASAAGKYTDRLYIIATTGDMYIKANAADTTLTQVGGNSAAMETMRQGISSNADAIASNYSVISAVSEDIYKSSGIAARLADAEAAISALGSLGEEGTSIVDALGHKLDKTAFSAYSSTTAATLSGLRTDVDAKLTTEAFNTYSSTTDATLTTIEGNISSNAAEIAGVKTSITNLTSSSAVTVSQAAGSGDVLKVYTIAQGGTTVGTINIPKDLVVTSGSVVVAGDGTNDTQVIAGATNGDKYIKLTVANQTAPIYIAVKDLVDVYTAQANATEVQLTIGNNNEISATIVDGSIEKSKLASTVQASLDKADSAVQDADLVYANILTQANGSTLAVDMSAVKGRIDNLQTFSSSAAATISSLTATIDSQIDAKIAELDSSASAQSGNYINSITMVDGKITAIGEAAIPTYTLSSGSSNGTVSFNGTDVAVTGLGTAAFTDATAYDAAGAADAVLGAASDDATENTVYGAKAAVVAAKNEVVGTSSDAAGTLTLNGLSSSIAILNSNGTGSVANQVALASSQAVTEANSYTDEALAWEVVAD